MRQLSQEARRNRLDLREGSFQMYNLKVPMVIEPWDLPE